MLEPSSLEVGLVLEDEDSLFEDSISENVRLGRALSEGDIKQAILYAQAKEFVEDENRGYYDKLNIKGANFAPFKFD